MFQYFSIHGFIIYLKGSGSLYDYFTFQYRQFKIARNKSNKFNLLINIRNISIDCKEKVFTQRINSEIQSYSQNDQFFWQVREKKIIIPKSIVGNNSIIEVDKDFPKMHFNTIFDFVLRLHFIKSGYFLLHAACVSLDNNGILITSSKAMGKTELAIKLAGIGYSFLSDDKVWMNENNNILSYPRYIVIKDSNANSFKSYLSKASLLKTNIKAKLLLSDENSNLSKLINYILRNMLKTKIYHLPVENIVPDCKTIKKTIINSAFILKEGRLGSIESVSPSYLQKSVISVNNLEWNNYIMNLVSVRDLIVQDDTSWVDIYLKLLSTERSIINKSLNIDNIHQILIGKTTSMDVIADKLLTTIKPK